MNDKVKVVCNKDQRWSFGRFKKDQVIEVSVDIGKTFVKLGYGDYYDDDAPKVETASSSETSEEEEKPEAETEDSETSEVDVVDSETEEEIDFSKITKKDSLEAYAKKKYGVTLDKRKTIPKMVAELEAVIAEQSEQGDD